MGPDRILGRLRHRGATSRIAGTLRRLLRRPPLYWTVVSVIALTAAAMVWASLRTAERAAGIYGSPREVLVAARDLPTGTRIAGTDVVRRRVPASALPPAALDRLPVGAVAAAPIDSGEVLTSRRLGRRGASAAALGVEAGRRGVAVPRGTDALPLKVGDLVDIAVAGTGAGDLVGVPDVDPDADPVVDPEVERPPAPATRAARGALVVAVDRRVAVVSVEERAAAGLAVAAADGRVQLILVGVEDRAGP